MQDTKRDYAKDPEISADDGRLSLALRELRQTVCAPVFWIVICIAAFLAAMAGPYFTLERLAFAERLLFWATTVTGSTLIMTFANIFTGRLAGPCRLHWSIAAAMTGVAGVLPIVATLYLAQGLATGFSPGWLSFAPFSSLVLSVAPVAVAVNLIVMLVMQHFGSDTAFERTKDAAEARDAARDAVMVAAMDAAMDAARPLTRIQRLLPRHLGHDIVTAQARDHYVEVTTPEGSAMILMRLNDAEEQLRPLNCLRVHRSWVVNLSHVAATQRGANGIEIVTTKDQRIPVGRRYREDLRKATGS